MHCALGLFCKGGFINVQGCWYNLYLTPDYHLWFQAEQVLLPWQSPRQSPWFPGESIFHLANPSL